MPVLPERVSRDGIFAAGAALLEHRHGGPEGALPTADGLRRGDLVPGLAGARRRRRPGWHGRTAVRNAGGRRLAPNGQKALGRARRLRPMVLRDLSHRRTEDAREPRRSYLLPCRPGLPRGDRATASPRWTARPGLAEIFFDDVEVPDYQVLGGPGRGRSVAVSMRRQRARPGLAQPGAATPRRPLDSSISSTAGRPAGAADAVARALHRRPGLPAAHLLDRHQGGRRAGRRARRPAATRSSGPRPTWPSTRPRWPSGPRRRAPRFGLSGRMARRVPRLRWPIRSTTGTHEIQRDVVAERLLGLPGG